MSKEFADRPTTCVRAMAFSLVFCGALFAQHGAFAADVVSESTSTPGTVRSPSTGNSFKVFEPASSIDSTLVYVNSQVLSNAAKQGGKVLINGLALDAARAVSLELEPLRVVGPKTKIVVGRSGRPDEPVAYDFSSIQMFHGKIQGQSDSSVVLFASPRGIRAHIELGAGRQRYLLSGVGSDSLRADSTLAEVRPVTPSGDRLPDVPLCGRDVVSLPAESGTVAGCCFEPPPQAAYNKRLAVAEIAIETDFELYANFNDLTITTDYVIEVIARTNAIFMRDVDTRFEVVFIRLFDNPADEPSFMSNADPLNGYVNFWNANMGGIARDTGTFLTGRRDLPYGGIAYIGAVCGDVAYCVCGYLNGFPDPTMPNSGDYDLGVVAHELGHNFNACHTPDYCPQVDQCYPPPVIPQRGTMMSYCSQTVSGGNLVTELWYHTRLRRVMRDFVEFSAFCLSYDCDQNGVDDAIDLAVPGADMNGNFVPDVCEDCNINGVLDPVDISSSMSTDLNGNAIPDECEPDCNNNNSPDDRDILVGSSVDLGGNGVPDECDLDCNMDGFADYNQIQSDLSLDIDRNVVLDACQDCDADGINDIVELLGARNAWVASDVLDYIGEYHAVSGVRVKTSTTGQVSAAQDLIITNGNRVLVSRGNANKVVAFHAITGVYQGDFVPAGSGGLSFPTGLTMAPDGNLLVSSRNTNNVLKYDGVTGSLIGAFVSAGSGGLASPFGLIFGPNGNLFVTSGGNQVLEFDGTTGAFVRVFVAAANNGGLNTAKGLVFKPDGNLLVASYGTDALLEYGGATGAFIGKWNSGGTASALYLDGPWGIRLGPNGNIFATRDLPATQGEGGQDDDHDHGHDTGVAELTAPLHVTGARIMEFDITNGQYLQSFIVGDDTGLRSTTGFDFMPGTADCNFNMMPDSCDLTACAGNPACGDCNTNGILDSCDIAGCGGMAACGDCNANGVPDSCDIAASTSLDVNPADGIPDECNVVAPGIPMLDPGAAKSRFISFSVPAPAIAGGVETALRIRLVSLHHASPPYTGGPTIPFTSFEGQVRWVGPPTEFVESISSSVPFHSAFMQCTPYYHNWSTIALLHVSGSAIVPSSVYEVENVGASCAGTEASCTAVSAPLAIGTTRWGDVEMPYAPPSLTTQPDVGDVSALVNKFRNAANAPTKARALLAGGDQFGTIDPSPDLDFSHIAACVDAFRGIPYPYTISTCP